MTLQSDTQVQRPVPLSIDTFLALVVLAVPFAVATIALHGLSDHILTFHGSDEEIFHYPIIRKFIATFPKMDLSDYPSATTPLYHVVSAMIGKLVSSDIRVLRAANVLISYASAVAIFALFQREIMTGWLTSLLVALTMVLSPYVFGVSFLLMTDNLAMLFAWSDLVRHALSADRAMGHGCTRRAASLLRNSDPSVLSLAIDHNPRGKRGEEAGVADGKSPFRCISSYFARVSSLCGSVRALGWTHAAAISISRGLHAADCATGVLHREPRYVQRTVPGAGRL